MTVIVKCNINSKFAVKGVVILVFVAKAFDRVVILFPTGDAPGLTSLENSSMNCFFCVFHCVKYPTNSKIMYGFRFVRSVVLLDWIGAGSELRSNPAKARALVAPGAPMQIQCRSSYP